MKKDSPYRYIEKLNTMFIPRTPTAALQAILEDVLPIEAFIYKSTGLNPIMKKPYNLDEIEWLLSRKDRDLETNLLLSEVLTEISQYKDKEVALFAAESLNAMEKQYNSRLVALKEKMAAKQDSAPRHNSSHSSFYQHLVALNEKQETKPEREDQSAAAEIYYHLALLNKKETTLYHFYLKEAYLLLMELKNRQVSTDEDLYLLIRVLINLKLYDQAEQLLPDAPSNRLVKLELAYEKRDSRKLNRLLNEMKGRDDLTDLEKETLDFWTGKHE